MTNHKTRLDKLEAQQPQQHLPILHFVIEPGDPEPVLPLEYQNYTGPQRILVVTVRIID